MFELTSIPVLGCSVVIAAVMFWVVVWKTPAWQGSWRGTLGRAGAAVALVVAVLLAIALAVNRDSLWFSRWSDLLGATAPATVSTHGAEPSQASSATVGTRPGPSVQIPASYPALPAPGSSLQKYSYTGSASGLTGDIEVILPPGYDPNSAPGTYPVIVAMHGYPGTPGGWTHSMDMPNYLTASVNAGNVAPTVVIAPTVAFPRGADTECLEGKAKIETWLTRDMVSFATEHFPVSTERSSWAAVGYSAGGWCAMLVGAKHAAFYGAAGSLDGYFRPMFGGKGESHVGTPYDLVEAARREAPEVALWVQVSKDSAFYDNNRAFVDAAVSPTSVTLVTVEFGGHRWSLWRRDVPTYLSWLGSNVSGFSPRA